MGFELYCYDWARRDREGARTGESEMQVDEVQRQQKKAPKRKAFIRTHASAFLQVWNKTIVMAKQQKPPVTVEDLRFEIGSIEIVGPSATEALLGILKPYKGETDDSQSPASIWSALSGITY